MIISFFKLKLSDSAERIVAEIIMFLSVVFAIGVGFDKRLPDRIKEKHCMKKVINGLKKIKDVLKKIFSGFLQKISNILQKAKKVIWIVSVAVYIVLYLPFICRAAYVVTFGPEKISTYEFMDDNVVVSKYGGSLVLMDCEVTNETLVIRKGKCHFRRISGSNLNQRTFKTVICR